MSELIKSSKWSKSISIILALILLLTAIPACSIIDAPKGAKYPEIEIREENDSTNVYCDGELIVEFRGNRYLRFRPGPGDNRWIGSEKSPSDMGWVYNDSKAKGMDVLSFSYENDPKNGKFTLYSTGKKPTFESKVDIALTAEWLPEQGKFKYTVNNKLASNLETWYQNASGNRTVEVFDYCVEYISTPELLMSKDHRKDPMMYEWFVKSSDGENWVKWPKIHVPYPTRAGNYVTIREPYNLSPVGGTYGMLDSKQGGWITKILKSPSSVFYEICWARFDVHVMLDKAVPARYSAVDLNLEFEMEFMPYEAEQANEIVNKAQEMKWRDMEEYKLPLFTLDNKFDKLISDIPSEETANHSIWWASTFYCNRDDTIGYDDNYSVSIKRPADTILPSAWNTFTWSQPFVDRTIRNKRYKLSAMVKLSECTGKVRLVVASTSSGDIYYGINGNGSHKRSDSKYDTDRIKWKFSDELTGTKDWTLLEMEFTAENGYNSIILEMDGTGQCWFDNVKIEELNI